MRTPVVGPGAGTGRPIPVVESAKTAKDRGTRPRRRTARWRPRTRRRAARPARPRPSSRCARRRCPARSRARGRPRRPGRSRASSPPCPRRPDRAGRRRPRRSRAAAGTSAAPSWWSSGIEPTASADPRSQTRVTRRGPTRSRSGPPSALKITSGAISAAATRPVWVAEPVVDSTNHGIAIIEIRVPRKEMPSAVRPPISGARRVAVVASAVIVRCSGRSRVGPRGAVPRAPGRGKALRLTEKGAASSASLLSVSSMTRTRAWTSSSAPAGVSGISQSLRVPTERHSSGRKRSSATGDRNRSPYSSATVVR